MTHAPPVVPTTEDQGAIELGDFAEAIYEMVARIIRRRGTGRGLLIDIGCGIGNLLPFVEPLVDQYIGADVVRYPNLPATVDFRLVNLDTGQVEIANNSADIVAAVETIEHLENPRALVREMTRIAKPGGVVIVTTPNQLSLLSKFTLVVKNQFNAFLQSNYPAHITHLLQVDLQHIAAECGLTRIEFDFDRHGRIIFTGKHFPRVLSNAFPRAFSDGIGMVATKPPQS